MYSCFSVYVTVIWIYNMQIVVDFRKFVLRYFLAKLGLRFHIMWMNIHLEEQKKWREAENLLCWYCKQDSYFCFKIIFPIHVAEKCDSRLPFTCSKFRPIFIFFFQHQLTENVGFFWLLQMTSLTIPYHHIAVSCMLLLVWNLSIIPHVSGQSNYASHANNIGYRGEGLPEEAMLDGKVSETFCYSICTDGILPIYWNCFWIGLQIKLTLQTNCKFKFKVKSFLFYSVDYGLMVLKITLDREICSQFQKFRISKQF